MLDSEYTGPERRGSKRHMFRTVVDCEWPEGSYFNCIHNMSMGGMFFETEEWLDQNTEVTLRFSMPNIDWIFESTARVVWVNKETKKEGPWPKPIYPGMGLVFTGLDEEDTKTLLNWFENIEENLKDDDE